MEITPGRLNYSSQLIRRKERRRRGLTPQEGKDGPTRGWGSVASHLGEQEEGVSSTEFLTEARRGVPAQSLTLSETGFTRSLADKRLLSQWSADIA